MSFRLNEWGFIRFERLIGWAARCLGAAAGLTEEMTRRSPPPSLAGAAAAEISEYGLGRLDAGGTAMTESLISRPGALTVRDGQGHDAGVDVKVPRTRKCTMAKRYCSEMAGRSPARPAPSSVRCPAATCGELPRGFLLASPAGGAIWGGHERGPRARSSPARWSAPAPPSPWPEPPTGRFPGSSGRAPSGMPGSQRAPPPW